MTVSSLFFRTVALAAAVFPVTTFADAPAEPPNACYSGAYKLEHGGDYIVISPSEIVWDTVSNAIHAYAP